MNHQTPKLPEHLAQAGRRFFESIVDAFELEPHHRELLRQACVCLDRIDEAQRIIGRDGLLIQDRYGTAKESPAVAIELQNKRLFRALVRELGLDIEPADAGYSRPPRLNIKRA